MIDACFSAGSEQREGEGLKGVHDGVVVVVIVAIVIDGNNEYLSIVSPVGN